MARSADRHYVTMAADAIEQLPVSEVAACHAHLFLWITGPSWCEECISRLCARGASSPPQSHSSGSSPTRKAFANGGFFLDETLFAKGMGHTTRQNAEYVVLGRRGKPRRLRKDVHQLIIQPRREHSRKPDELYARVERYCTGPYLELFARQRRPGWDCWGNEIDKFEPEYDAHDDFAKSLEEGYRVIRERVAAGGPKWVPK